MKARAADILHGLCLGAGRYFFKVRNGLFPLVFLLMAIFTRPAVILSHRALDAAVAGVGVLVALLGEVVRGAVIGLVYIKRGGKEGQVYAEDLVQQGIYAHSRNPMYLGNLLLTLGLCLLHGSPWAIFGIFPFFVFVYFAIVAEEERYLRERFGSEFDDYCRRVNRFWPRWTGMRETFRQYRFNARKVISKEHGTFFGLMSGLYLLVIWKYPLGGKLDGWPEPLGAWSLPAIVLLAGYGLVRFLKWRGKLEYSTTLPVA